VYCVLLTTIKQHGISGNVPLVLIHLCFLNNTGSDMLTAKVIPPSNNASELHIRTWFEYGRIQWLAVLQEQCGRKGIQA
jgi:hypothetical protein